MEQNTEQNTTNTEEISNSQDTNNTDIEPETEEVLAEIVDTLEKPELKPKRERSAAQKRAFEKARLCLADKRRIAREQKALEPNKPRGRPVKKTTLPAQESIENTENLDNFTNNLKKSKKKNVKKTQVIIDESESSSDEEIIYVKNKRKPKSKIKKQPKIIYVSASEDPSEEEYYEPPVQQQQSNQQQQPELTFMYV